MSIGLSAWQMTVPHARAQRRPGRPFSTDSILATRRDFSPSFDPGDSGNDPRTRRHRPAARDDPAFLSTRIRASKDVASGSAHNPGPRPRRLKSLEQVSRLVPGCNASRSSPFLWAAAGALHAARPASPRPVHATTWNRNRDDQCMGVPKTGCWRIASYRYPLSRGIHAPACPSSPGCTSLTDSSLTDAKRFR